MSGKIFTSCYSFDRKNLCSEIIEMSFPFSCKLGNKQRSSVDGGGGGGGGGKVGKLITFLLGKRIAFPY